MSSPNRHLWKPLLTLCVLALLAFPAAAGQDEVSSGDNDGGWGLPGPAQEAVADLTVDVLGPVQDGLLDYEASVLVLSRVDVAETLLTTTDDADEAEVVVEEPLGYLPTDGAVEIQGAGELLLDESLQATLRTPHGANHDMAFLLVDQGAGSAAALLDDPAAKFAITWVLPLGPLGELDVSKLSKLAVQHADALADDDPATPAPALSVLHLSIGSDGELHPTLVRATADGDVEFVLR